MAIDFPLLSPADVQHFNKIFMNMQMRLLSYMSMTSTFFSLYCITGAVTKCDNDNLGLKLVYSWIYNHFKSLLMFSLKFMNMQIS